MTTYNFVGPDGKNYTLEGPPGTSRRQLMLEAVRQKPELKEYLTPERKPEKRERTAGSTALEALRNAPRNAFEVANAIATLPNTIGDLATEKLGTPEARRSTLKALKEEAQYTGSVVAGGVQRNIRDRFPGQPTPGTTPAPRIDTKDYDEYIARTKKGIKEATGKQRIYQELATNPVGTAAAVASVAVPVLRASRVGSAAAAGEAVAGREVKAALKRPEVPAGLADELKAIEAANPKPSYRRETERLKTGAVDERRAVLQERQNARRAAVQEAAAARSGARSERAAAAAEEAAMVNPTRPELAIGTPRDLGEIGESIRGPAQARQAAIENQMREADQVYRGAMNDIAAEQAARNIGASDMPTAKAIVQKYTDTLNPKPGVGYRPADPAGAKLMREAMEVLTPLDGVKPDLRTVEEFRRRVGDIANGNVEGYGAINKTLARDLYTDLNKVADEYVSGASEQVRNNWRQGKEALEAFESTRIGQGIVGTQKGTDVPGVPAAAIPGRMVAGGADTVRQVAAVAGPGATEAALRSQIQNQLTGVRSADAFDKAVGKGTTIGDALRDYPGLSKELTDYGTALRKFEADTAEDIARADRMRERLKAAGKLDKVREAQLKRAMDARVAARQAEMDLTAVEKLSKPEDVTAGYRRVLDERRKAGAISQDKYESTLKRIETLEKRTGGRKRIRKLVRDALVVAGGSAGVTYGVNAVLGGK